MSRSHDRATTQNFAEFAQNLEMCTPKLENSCIFKNFTCFCTFDVTFQVFFVHFLAPFILKYGFDSVKNLSLECLCAVCSVGCELCSVHNTLCCSEKVSNR